uniref:Uncharacterized protein n=1 Tax=Octactis speculum TaxID=3111310 RepID=A0A7S2GNV6_9STRA|mmetsp:Transcript_53326/g.72856  ORF Transcript_53326/g.72856 Transcript_53326/m.72856 type:complete len:227 (+) Transcript_53326:150-830(+)|eukprot:CAMPEP_0185747258 /NCGR_PEP_ID=MMETSP1174-20130828/5863_1 /TAXON_ID=35687 /ORGANISM="Dictyocha speculum, Strain CCMP1381" /LENGTH=226 /DNA_ID=CAMNT_0028422337 /DNA_START=141 /DNA_END=821 /DNA_ORIENTATION=-
MSFFTAGTGNAGATIVSATFLLLCQKALSFRKGDVMERDPWTSPREVDFGPGAGRRTVRLLDNPDVYTTHASLAVPNLSSRFATAPSVWNTLFGALQAVLPATLLADRAAMQALSVFSLPIIRLVDRLVGATNAMRIDASDGDGNVVNFAVTHDDLEQCVGLATAAFALEMFQAFPPSGVRGIPPGVYFPGELPKASRTAILERVKQRAAVWEFSVIKSGGGKTSL